MSGDLRPPDSGSSASFGMHASWRTSSLVSLARKDSFPFWSLAEKPFVSVGTMKPRIEFTSSSLPVLAHTIAACAGEPLGVHILALAAPGGGRAGETALWASPPALAAETPRGVPRGRGGAARAGAGVRHSGR